MRLVLYGDVKHIKGNEFEVLENSKADFEGFSKELSTLNLETNDYLYFEKLDELKRKYHLSPEIYMNIIGDGKNARSGKGEKIGYVYQVILDNEETRSLADKFVKEKYKRYNGRELVIPTGDVDAVQDFEFGIDKLK